MDRTKLGKGHILYLYRAGDRPISIARTELVDDGHIPDVAGAETVDPEGSPFLGIVVAAVLSLPVWWIVAYLLHRLTGLNGFS